MLFQLSIRNFALIDDIRLDFDHGLNVLTGETGAGKSILIDALRLVLGERASGDVFRDPGKDCVLEAVFSVPQALREKGGVLEGFLEEEDDCLILRRELSPGGRSKNYVNRQFVNLSLLREIGSGIVEYHGQYDQQHIFEPQTHLEMIDRLAGLKGGDKERLLGEYRELYTLYTKLSRGKKEVQEAGEGRQRQMDLLSYQIDEIEKVSPEEGEEESLISERLRLAHAQKLHELTADILDSLDEEEHSAASRIGAAFRAFSGWAKIDSDAEEYSKRLENIQVEVEELIRSVRDYQEGLVFDESRLEETEQRLDALERLKRKYGGSVKEVKGFLEKAKLEYDRLENSDVYRRDIDRELERITPLLEEKAEAVSKLRKKIAFSLKKEVKAELQDLGLAHAEFDIRFDRVDFGPLGVDCPEFLLSPNPGHGLKPLIKIASGGEASRILLALKRALARADDIPTLIFDEIDANIGGRLGDVVGRKLKEVSVERQILLITHLPQIASFAERHYKVVKRVSGDRTEVRYELLEGEARVRELAQMMSGMKESEISRTHAAEMLKTAGK